MALQPLVTLPRPRSASSEADALLKPSAASAGADRPKWLALRLLEIAFVGLLLAALWLQLIGYPIQTIRDIDGYVTYAQLMQTRLSEGTFELWPNFWRMPGYPLFIAVVTILAGQTIDVATNNVANESVYWAQIALAFVFIVGVWMVLRCKLGRLPALMFLGIMAAPNYFARQTANPQPDVVYGIIWVPFALFVGYWAFRQRGPWDLLWLGPFALVVTILQALRPNGTSMTLLLAVGLAVAFIADRLLRRDGRGWRPLLLGPFWPKLAGLVLMTLVVFWATDYWLDTGARAFNTMYFSYRVVVALPPASDTPEDARIEDLKRRISEVEGEPIEGIRFTTFRKFSNDEFFGGTLKTDAAAVWKDRLLAYPWLYAQAVFNDLRWNHYRVARHYVPLFSDVPSLVSDLPYPPADGSWTSIVFRTTGLTELRKPDYAAHWGWRSALVVAVLELIAVWGTLGLGIAALARLNFRVTTAMGVTIVLSSVMTAAIITLDARYTVPFAIFIYVAQAVGLVSLIELLRRGRA